MNKQFNLNDAMSDLNSSLASLRDRIGHLNSEARSIRSAAVTLDTALARVDAHIQQRKDHLAQMLPLAAHFCEPNSSGPRMVDLDRIIAYRQIDDVGEFLKEGVREYLKGRPALDAAERASKLAKIGREKLDLELTEESIIRQGESLGFDIPRRADADVRAVLAHDSAMP